MAKKSKGMYSKVEHESVFHKTNIGRNPSTCKMNKHKRRQFKKYNGQGKGWQSSIDILYIGHERNNNKQKERYNAKNNN